MVQLILPEIIDITINHLNTVLRVLSILHGSALQQHVSNMSATPEY